MELCCLLGTTRCIPQKNFPESHILNPLLTKLVRSRCRSFFASFVSFHKNAEKELGQYPAILTSHLSITHIHVYYRDRAAFLQLGGLNKMAKALLGRAAGASVLGESGDMPPPENF